VSGTVVRAAVGPVPMPTATPPAPSSRRHGSSVLLALTAVAVAAGVVVALTGPADRVGDPTVRMTVVSFLAGMLGLAVVGRLVLARSSGQERIGWLLLAVGALGAAGRAVIAFTLVDPSETSDAVAWSTNWIWVPGATAVLLLLLRFPTGALPTPAWRWAERAVLAWGVLAVVVTAVVPGALAVTPLDRRNPYGADAAGWLENLLSPLFSALPVLTVLSAGALLARYRRADDEERQQLRWVGCAIAVLALASLLAATGNAGAALFEGTAYLLLPAAVVVAVLRYRLWDLGLVLRRGLTYALASGALLAAYVGTVTASQGLLRGRAPDAIATAVIAVAAVPVLTAVQRGVERVLFGNRRDPDRVVDQLAARLAATPEALLPQVVAEVARSLRLSYVAIELADGTVPAVAGVPGGPAHRVPLQHRGSTVGWLVAGWRAPAEQLGVRDVQLLERVADHAGLAVHSTLLTAELQHASDRLREARAEERARLRGDLHDELGPALGAISMRAEAARNLLTGGDVARVDDVLTSIEEGAEAAVAEVRRILADLQPTVLEEEGLHAALRSAALAVPAGLQVHLDLDFPLTLPRRVELAAYRVTVEALRNAVRHASARTVQISLRLATHGLEVTVIDDGTGLGPDHRPGVGIESMHARAAELGGTLVLARAEAGGTMLRLVLPVAGA
jgi:two-component system, NarL family, sensor kinase